jgi:hypothetical protein
MGAPGLRESPTRPKWPSVYPVKDYNVKFFLVLWFVNRYEWFVNRYEMTKPPQQHAYGRDAFTTASWMEMGGQSLASPGGCGEAPAGAGHALQDGVW